MVLGVETVLWQDAAEKAGKLYRGVLEPAERLMVRWHENEATLSMKRRASGVGRGLREWGGEGTQS